MPRTCAETTGDATAAHSNTAALIAALRNA
jgi:hypothetical protein